MYEVEAKVRLRPADYRRLKKKITEIAIFEKETVKIDRYYGDGLSYGLRIREERDCTFLTFKDRVRKQGIEINDETGIPIDPADPWDQLLRQNGIPALDVLEKKTLRFRLDPFVIEFKSVRGLYDFLEIEYLASRKSEIPKAHRGVIALFRQLGFTPKDFERKSYLELLQKKKKS